MFWFVCCLVFVCTAYPLEMDASTVILLTWTWLKHNILYERLHRFETAGLHTQSAWEHTSCLVSNGVFRAALSETQQTALSSWTALLKAQGKDTDDFLWEGMFESQWDHLYEWIVNKCPMQTLTAFYHMSGRSCMLVITRLRCWRQSTWNTWALWVYWSWGTTRWRLSLRKSNYSKAWSA